MLAFLFTGLGHLYVGKITRGLGWMGLGIATWVFSIFALIALLDVQGGFLVTMTMMIVASFVVWILNIYDAYRLCNEYNDALRRTGGNPPW
ncbi:MAG: hypothetical protein LBG62_03610 [Candidatus Methanoplasma sp.]|nr:hypothetical protein [Candidatus Methanoplasma sp.]